MKIISSLTIVLFAVTSVTFLPGNCQAASASVLEKNAKAALHVLYASNPKAAAIGKEAKAVLVFPNVVKGGFLVAAHRGDGVLLVNGRAVAYYNLVGGSYGLQAGVQKSSYAMFFMNDASLNYLKKSGGWEVGTAPSLVVVDSAVAGSLSTTTLNKGIYVFFFNQKGLMGGLGLQGTKITEYTPSK
jgi:lipid-binding SYLF domain-containing protein